jgi:uncharacterized repeat protein (TIGR01451 family)
VSGASLQLLAPGLDNNLAVNWCEAVTVWAGSAGDRGTPGTANTCPTDLALSKNVSEEVVPLGQNVVYTLVYTNQGPAIATALITDIIPLSLTNVSVSSSGPPITPLVGMTYTWQVAEFEPGSGGVITLTGQVGGVSAMKTTFARRKRA